MWSGHYKDSAVSKPQMEALLVTAPILPPAVYLPMSTHITLDFEKILKNQVQLLML